MATRLGFVLQKVRTAKERGRGVSRWRQPVMRKHPSGDGWFWTDRLEQATIFATARAADDYRRKHYVSGDIEEVTVGSDVKIDED